MSESEKITNQNTVWHEPIITRSDRESLNRHRSCILWFTGLSGSGKSTLAHALEERLHEMGKRTYVLDGDNIRKGLCGDLGFSDEDRTENIRRIGEVAKLMFDAGVIVMTAFISPFRRDRQVVRDLVSEGDFIEVFCDASLEVCEGRDVKGLYKKARAGEIPEFTGISSPYEEPLAPELKLATDKLGIEACVDAVVDYLEKNAYLDLK
ncbi:MAG: adenylyl-sulfate kinase [Gammaproteobacteria bacterium]